MSHPKPFSAPAARTPDSRFRRVPSLRHTSFLHGATFGSRYAARFLDVLAPVRLVLYGSPSDEVKAALAPFNPVVMAPAAGFSR